MRADRRTVVGIGIVAVLIGSICARGASTIRRGGGDFRGYVEVGELVLAGEDPYATRELVTNTWPPLFSVLSVPLALGARAAPRLTMTVWLVAMVGCLYGCLHYSIWLVYRRPLTFAARQGAIRISSAAALVPMLFIWRYVLKNVRWLQINFLIMLLVLAGCYLIARHRQERGGTLIGAGAAIKVMPVLFVPYFALKRWWPAAIGGALSGALLSSMPILVFGPVGWSNHVRTWIERTRSNPVPVYWDSHSLYAMVDRYVGHRVLTDRALQETDVMIVATGHPLVHTVTTVLALGLVVVFVSVARRRGRDPASPEAAVEFAMLLAMIPLMSPTMWTHYLVYLLFGYVVLWRAVTTPVADDVREAGLSRMERRLIRLFVSISVVLSLLATEDIAGSVLARRSQMLSTVTFSALTVYAALAYLRWLMGRRPVWVDS